MNVDELKKWFFDILNDKIVIICDNFSFQCYNKNISRKAKLLKLQVLSFEYVENTNDVICSERHNITNRLYFNNDRIWKVLLIHFGYYDKSSDFIRSCLDEHKVYKDYMIF